MSDPETELPNKERSNTALPSEELVLDYINSCVSPPSVRDIARALKLPQELRAPLRRMIRQMAENGTIARQEGRRVAAPDQLPEVTVLEITGFDDQGDCMAVAPSNTKDEAPEIRVLLSKKAGRAPAIGQSILARLAKTGPNHYEARIIRLLDRQQKRMFGVVTKTSKGFRLAPAERGKRDSITIQSSPDTSKNSGGINWQDGDLVEAELMPSRGYMGKTARVIRTLGPADERGAFSALALAEFNIRHSFPDDVIAEADALKAPNAKGREDLRSLSLVTIDGADARDFDDAVYAETLDNGGWRLLIAIADVSHYVRPDSPLDTEARRRGNSVYLPDMVVPMLPEAISNDLCSLRPLEDRAAMVAEVIITAEGNKTEHRIFRALIRSHARLTYDQVQSVYEGTHDEDDIGVGHGVLHNLFAAWRALDIARQEREPLALNMKERRVVMDESGQAVAISQRSQNEAQRLIEDFMITANVVAAEILIAGKRPCVFRVHDQPDPKKADSLYDLAKTVGANFTKGQVLRPHHFNAILRHVRDSDDELMVNEAVLRSQAKAIYSIDNIGHFGLSLRNYAHFTSPIRRYADLLVHRALVDNFATTKAPKDGLNGMAGESIAEICQHISETESNAAGAERRTIDRFAASLFSSRVTDIVDGTIAGITGFGAFVRLEDGTADGFLPLSGLPDDYYNLDAAGQVLTGRHTGWSFTTGTKLKVQILEVTPISGGILLGWEEGGIPNDRSSNSRRKQSTPSAGKGRHHKSARGNKKSGKRKRR